MELPKTYEPATVEENIFQKWEAAGLFDPAVEDTRETYCIVIPPPNVTGVLHMGHALNNTIQDVLIRKARLDGKNPLWVLGTDHAGIATQNVVERHLKKQGKTRHGLGREAFLREVWAWKESHGGVIIRQLKKMGCSLDYRNERFTMDDGLARAVGDSFIRLHQMGLIYRGDRMIHWCPRCHTALSDEEAEHHEISGNLYTLRYPRTDGQGFLRVATTRPETLLGDTGIAVHPEDDRYRDVIGATVTIPFVDRPVPVIADAFVDPAFGTGAVKITPAHDPNDYEMGLRHDLPQVEVIDKDGNMAPGAGPYAGMDRFACRKQIISDLEARGLLEKIEEHPMAVRRCYRCDSVVEPRVSRQWFVRMKPLAEKALRSFEQGAPRFTPERYGNIYRRWLEGIRDWCISRQIWWGHPIPAFICEACGREHVQRDPVKNCAACGASRLHAETDVLDTWFSSWLWPFSTLGWPDETALMARYYPTQTLTTAQEIIFFWVARMVMAGLEFTGKVPFDDVYIHGTVRDESGLKMSKSFGNVLDPLHIIERYGADALRFSLMVVASRGSDIYLSDKKFEIGRNFATKIWNASRFILGQTGETAMPRLSTDAYISLLTLDDRLVLRRLDEMVVAVDQGIREFRFNDAALALYDFFWKSFCDRYIEYVKPLLAEDGENRERSFAVLLTVLRRFLVCLHPFMPFITEELWARLRTLDPSLEALLAQARFPSLASLPELPRELLDTERKYEFIKAARGLRQRFNTPPRHEVHFTLKVNSDSLAFVRKEWEFLRRMIRASELLLDENFEPARPMPFAITDFGTLFMELDSSFMDQDAEKERLLKKKAELELHLRRSEGKLQNAKFLEGAPQEVILKEQEKKDQATADLEKIEETLQYLVR